MIKSKKLSLQNNISHGFFDKNGGTSKGIYKSLNCGLGSNDKKNLIKKNLKIVKNKISKNSKNIFFHSSSVFRHKWMLLPSSKNFLAGIVAITTNINLFDKLHGGSGSVKLFQDNLSSGANESRLGCVPRPRSHKSNWQGLGAWADPRITEYFMY